MADDRWAVLMEQIVAAFGRDLYISDEARAWFEAHPDWVADLEPAPSTMLDHAIVSSDGDYLLLPLVPRCG